MTDFCDKAKAFCVSEDGLTTTEYAIMLALIVLVALTAISGMSMKVDGVFTTIGGGSSGGDSEAEAREARYGWLAAICAETGALVCVTGHTMDDQAETVLLRLTRGAGLRGAAAMAAEAPLPVDRDHEPDRDSDEGRELRLLRPLLEIARADIGAYLDALELTPRIDPTNADVAIDRNRVRHRVLPELEALNPDVTARLAHFAALARQDDEALQEWARAEFWRIGHCEAGSARVRRKALLELPVAIASRLLRLAAAPAGASLDGAQVAQLLRLARRRGARLSLGGAEARTDSEALVITRSEKVSEERVQALDRSANEP
ncbi:MAG: tRNA lysidine(34) synthetase TilS [Planctomycetes bacterium]|nr:tRNA lysidine(34) synthetase TilS [Planctomycetota bacterium]